MRYRQHRRSRCRHLNARDILGSLRDYGARFKITRQVWVLDAVYAYFAQTKYHYEKRMACHTVGSSAFTLPGLPFAPHGTFTYLTKKKKNHETLSCICHMCILHTIQSSTVLRSILTRDATTSFPFSLPKLTHIPAPALTPSHSAYPSPTAHSLLFTPTH